MKRRVTLYLREEVVRKVDIMRAMDLMSRSAFVGQLVEDEWGRFKELIRLGWVGEVEEGGDDEGE